jgi:hypothetical protein
MIPPLRSARRDMGSLQRQAAWPEAAPDRPPMAQPGDPSPWCERLPSAKEDIADHFANLRVRGLTACSPDSQARSAYAAYASTRTGSVMEVSSGREKVLRAISAAVRASSLIGDPAGSA